MATAFLGYVLPWGQMSFWAATVITNLFSAFPIIGEPITLWLWGGFSVNNPTLKRFFVLHYLLPFIILAVVIIHFILLHNVGSSNPFGLNFFDVITFYPYYFLKDLVAVFFFFVLFLFFNGAYPHIFMHPDNDIIANSGVTPSHIVPEWYFLPFYAMLRAVPNKMGGVICMFLSIIILFFLPFLVHFTGVSVTTFRPVLKFFLLDFYFNFYFLGCLGAAPVEQPFVFLSRLLTFWYFFFLLFFLPFISFIEVCAITINDNIFKKNVELKRKLGSLTK
jgi:ubiquinol-cytochrome c reductase cytochrome b subunit